MKRIILTVLMALVLAIPAYAEEGDAATDQPIQQEQEPVVVATLDELQAAIDAAEDGDTIALDATIKMMDGDTLITDKHIILVRHEGFAGKMIEVYGNGVISGFSFIENGLVSSSTITTRAEGNGEITIENCSFKADGDNGVSHFIMADIGDTVTIRGCTFYCGNGYVIYSQRETNVLLDSCTFLKGNYYTWQMIAAYGEMAVDNCIFDAETGCMTAALDGKITISNCQMNANYFKKRIYPNIYLEDKISGAGTISILDEPIDGEGFYDLYTGEKVELPIAKIDDLSVLAYMTDEQAIEYFAVESNIGRFDIKVDERSGHFDEDEPEEPDIIPGTGLEQPTNPDVDNPNNTDDPGNNPENGDQNTPQEPVQPPQDGNEDDPTDTPSQPPQEPTQPPEGKGTGKPNNPPNNGDQDVSQKPVQPPQAPSEKPVEPPEGNRPVDPPAGNNPVDKPTDNQPEVPEQPKEPPVVPPQDDTPDKPTDTTPDTPQPPQKPSDGNSGSNPPADYRPSQRPTRPTVIIRDRTESKVQTQPDTPTTAQPPLVCNGAVIDTTRTVVLLGYKDGLLHEDDLLTRAQLAAIIYRLLDDASIVLYSNAELTFDDIPADAWCAQYVRVMQAAGIVNGIGGGKYNPNGTVTWAHVLTILSRFVEPQKYTLQNINYNSWAVKSVQTAVALGWIEDNTDFTPDAAITRGELTRLINDVLALY